MMVYLFKAAIISAVLYSFYVVVFSRNTYYRLNRSFLLFIMFFSFVCPLLRQLQTFNIELISESLWIDEFYFYPAEKNHYTEAGISTPWNIFLQLLFWIYFAGAGTMCFRLVKTLSVLVRLGKTSEIAPEGYFYMPETKSCNAPFSFFNNIYLPARYKNFDGREVIIEHEKVHVKQLHSLDLLIAEAFCIILWFNPFVFLLKRSLKSVHEYLADEAVIHNKLPDKPAYLRLLIAGCEVGCKSGIVNHFSYLSIKKRIKMILKNKTSNSGRFIYLLVLPVLLILAAAFSNGNTSNPPAKWPVEGGKITLRFGYEGKNPVTNKDFVHGGIDIKTAAGTNVSAAASGVVTEASFQEGWGNLIVIRHDEEYETWYAHLQDFKVSKGDRVSLGQVIGHVGNTGNSTGPHLHFEVRKNGERVDPESYFAKQ
jgi:hypothetical protein